MSGALAYHSGLAAEESVARLYQQAGHRLRARRWRGQGGELDLVLEQDEELIFVEVKSSRTHARALESLSQRQLQRICMAAQEFVANEPAGLNTAMRIDLATVDGTGQVELHKHILM